MTKNNIKKPCHDDPEHLCECYGEYSGGMDLCDILLHGGTWEDCRFGKEWKEPAPPGFEGD